MNRAKIRIPRNAITVRRLPSTKRRSWRLILCWTLRWNSAGGSATLLHCSRQVSSSWSSIIPSLRSWSLSQRVLQRFPCPVQAHCHIVFCNAHHFRDFRVRQALEHEYDHLPVSHGQRLNCRHKPNPLVGSRRLLLRMRPRINRLVGLFDLLERLMRRPSLPYMAKPAIVSNAVHECPLRALASKMSQRLPDRQRDLLYQFFPDAGHSLITERQPRDGRPILTENAIELFFQSVAVFAHGCDLASESICD